MIFSIPAPLTDDEVPSSPRIHDFIHFNGKDEVQQPGSTNGIDTLNGYTHLNCTSHSNPFTIS